MRFPSHEWRRSFLILVAVIGLSGDGRDLAAQNPPPARPQFKGIWEPVSYTEDLDLTDVFFVTTEVGWAAGEGGTIIHTRDGGATWAAQLGGDPGSSEAKITMLRFLDEHRGWAIQGKKLLHTANGQGWEEVSGALPNWMAEYAFVSGRRGVASGTTTSQGYPTQIFLTEDGGRTWTPVAECGIRVLIDGVNRSVACIPDRFQFVTPDVGYVVAYVECSGMCGGPPIIGKTEDGGASWRFILGPGDVKMTRLKDLFFVDEQIGFVHAYTYPGEPKIFATSDGGETWKGVVGSPGQWLRFADPQVGWGFHELKLSYTTDGGVRWNSRPHRFPANPRAISFPRRDRGYVVGDHGMVFRYRVVPAAEPTRPEVIVTVAMPGFDSPLDEEAAQVEALVAELEAAVERAPDSVAGSEAAASAADASGAAAAAADSTAEPPSAAAVVAEQPTAFTAACCKQPVGKFNLVITALAKSLPSFLSQYKNTNLLVAGLRMLTDLPGSFGDLRTAVQAFKNASDKSAAEAALAQIGSAAQALHSTTKAAFQQEIPPVEPESDSGAAIQIQSDAAVEAVVDSAAAVVDSAAVPLGKEAKKKAKQGLGGLLKKKLKIP
jgi:photosystem II stability/assembly factor-like uncharacterized protein